MSIRFLEDTVEGFIDPRLVHFNTTPSLLSDPSFKESLSTTIQRFEKQIPTRTRVLHYGAGWGGDVVKDLILLCVPSSLSFHYYTNLFK